MLKLELNRYEKRIVVPDDVKKVFNEGLITYSLSKGTNPYLNLFIIFDFQNEKAIYLSSSSEANIALINDSKYLEEKGIAHAVTPISKGVFISSVMSFDTLDKSDKSFRVINLHTDTMTIYDAEDLGLPLGLISDTIERDDEGYLHLCLVNDNVSRYYRLFPITNADGEISFEATLTFENVDTFQKPPHQVIHHRGLIFSTGFFERQFKIGDVVLKGDNELKDFVSRKMRKLNFKNVSFHDITTKLNIFNYEVMPGEVLVHNILKQSIQKISVGCSPSHVVFDEDYAYVLSNNITGVDNKIFYLAPGRLSKLKITSTGVETVSEFYDDSGYRFTSHKLIKDGDKRYIATIGHPNRLFLIDCESMELMYSYDIKENILDNIDTDVRKYLNDIHNPLASDPWRYSALEIKGDFIILINQEEILFFNYKTKQIDHSIQYDLPSNYFQFTQHCDFVEI